MVGGLAVLRTILIATVSLGTASIAMVTVMATGEPEESNPCLVIWRYGGNAPGANQGLELAVWPDGSILLSPRSEALGKNLLAGRVDPNDLAAALSMIREVGFQKLTRDWFVPDSAGTTIFVSDDKVTRRSWHEYLLPGFGGDINTDHEYCAFVRTWKKTCAAIEGLAPIELRRLEEAKEFRGYVVDAPEKTPWRPR